MRSAVTNAFYLKQFTHRLKTKQNACQVVKATHTLAVVGQSRKGVIREYTTSVDSLREKSCKENLPRGRSSSTNRAELASITAPSPGGNSLTQEQSHRPTARTGRFRECARVKFYPRQVACRASHSPFSAMAPISHRQSRARSRWETAQAPVPSSNNGGGAIRARGASPLVLPAPAPARERVRVRRERERVRAGGRAGVSPSVAAGCG